MADLEEIRELLAGIAEAAPEGAPRRLIILAWSRLDGALVRLAPALGMEAEPGIPPAAA